MTTPKKQAIREWTMVAALILVTVASTVVAIYVPKVEAAQKTIIANQEEGEIRGYKLRAVGCRALEASTATTFPHNDPCLEPDMHAYFTPKVGP